MKEKNIKQKNKVFLEKFHHAVDVINSSKKADGSLPKAVDLNLEIEKFEKAKDEIERKNLVANAKLNRYKVIENNLKIILSNYQGRNMKNRNKTKENDNRYQELQ